MALGVRDIQIKFKGDTSDLDRATATGEKQMSKWKSGFQKFNKVAVPAALAVGAAAIKVGKDSVELSRKIGDMDAKAQAVFGGQIGRVQKWAEQNKRAFGLSSRETVGLAANFADLLVPMGFTAKEAANMSTEVLDLSGALSKWSGGQYDAAEVSEILSKAMLGERDQLKSLGIAISEADVQQRLAKNGADELKGSALQQAKAIATQELIMEKSTDAQKAWADGGRDAAVAENSLSTGIQELKEGLAVALTPAIEKVTGLLAEFGGWAEKNQGLIMTLGAVLLGLAAAVFVVNAAVAAWTAATKVAIGVQKLLNLVMRMNPIGIVITALMLLIGVIILAWKKSETFRKIVKAVWDAVKKAIKSVVDWVVNTAWPWLKRAWQSISDAVGNMRDRVQDAWNAVKDKVRAVVDNVRNFVSGMWDRVSSGIASVRARVESIWGSIVGKVHGAVNGIKSFLSGMWDGMVSGARSAVNGAISIINGAIGALNSLINGVNNVPGVDIPNIPNIPMLADGGVVTRPTLAVIGEDGPEAVVPLSKGRAAMGQYGGGGDTYNVNVQAWTDRFSLKQVKDELAMQGVA